MLCYIIMGKRHTRHHHSSSVAKRLKRVERELEKDKPEVKTLDVLINPLTATGYQAVTNGGIWNGTTSVNYDLTSRFVQGLLNEGGNIDGNYCKLTSIDCRILLDAGSSTFTGASPPPTRRIRMMIVRVPNADTLTPADVQSQVLEYGTPATYGELASVSPLKRNSTINGGYDVMYDRVHLLTSANGSAATAIQPTSKTQKYVHFRKKWKNGLTLRFSGSGAGLVLEQNRLYLFAFAPSNPQAGAPAANWGAATISMVSRIRYSDE